jgi:hypothetical protein
MKLFPKTKIQSGTLKYFGNQLIDTNLVETKIFDLAIPANFSFNHSWDFQHNCSNCKNKVSICEDFEKKTKTFRVIDGIDSSRYNIQVITDLSSMFQKIEAIEIENITYLNRTDFNYEFEFQRKSSISLIDYCCCSCNAIYLGSIRIGYPLYPEKNLIEGELGNVVIDEILEVNVHLHFFNHA